jgi:UDP-2-acetamido-2-deoxy-ribo-hexuluronate aminotransferase
VLLIDLLIININIFNSMKIEMVDLKSQYHKIKNEIDAAVLECFESAEFINGKKVTEFAQNLAQYTGAKYVIPCANGTDAIQIALMALELKLGDEVIVPSFTYVATAEVIKLLGLVPVMVDVHSSDFRIDLLQVKRAVTNKTKAIVPVHLFGQCAEMEELMQFAKSKGIFIIEDAAQAIGVKYTFSNGDVKQAGTIGDIGTTSFFPSKNLGCYGDGGAIFTNDEQLAIKLKMIANHGQAKKYHHEIVGVNSRLDTIQAAILDVKLKYLDSYEAARNKVADYYDKHLSSIPGIEIPARVKNSTHVFHQYTLKIKEGKRDQLREHLLAYNIPTMVYYPVPLHFQNAFKSNRFPKGCFPVAESLSDKVLSLPIHTEMDEKALNHIVNKVKLFFENETI